MTCSSRNAHHAAKRVSSIIEEVGQYLDNWGIEINVEKTEFLLVRPQKKSIKKKNKGEVKLV